MNGVPGDLDEHIKESRMLPHPKIPAQAFICFRPMRDRNGIGPFDVFPGDTAIITHQLDAVCQDVKGAFLPVLFQNSVWRAVMKRITVKMIGYGFFNSAGAFPVEGMRPYFAV